MVALTSSLDELVNATIKKAGWPTRSLGEFGLNLGVVNRVQAYSRGPHKKTPFPLQYGQENVNTTAVARQAKAVLMEYDRKFKTLDLVFAMDVVGDGISKIVGPFETAQGRFYWGKVIPLFADTFGDVNLDFKKVINCLAEEAAAGIDGLTYLTTHKHGQKEKSVLDNA